MRRVLVFALLAALTLAGCAGPAANPDWDESWVQLAGYVGIEPLDGFELNESNDLLSVSGLYYATWTAGAGQDFVNGDGNEAVVYDAQIYVLLEECRSGEAAKEAVGVWMEREKRSYETEESFAETLGEQEFEILPLISGSEDNPYPHGAAAFAARDEWGICVELVCGDGFEGDTQAILEQFLSGFHYREQ